MSVIGYLLISVLLLLLFAVCLRIIIDLGKTQPDSIPMGPLAKEVSDIVLDNMRKFVAIQEDSMLSYVSAGIILVLIILIKIFLT